MSPNLRCAWLVVVVLLMLGLAACAPAPTPAAPTPPPPPEEKVTVNWAVIAGFYTDWAEEVTREFEEETGIDVNIVNIDFAQLYEKEVLEMVGKTGAYDVITIESGWKGEWASAGYLLPLDDYIAASDPAEIQFEDIAPALIEIANTWEGKVYGLPYYTYTQGMFYRCDLFEDEGEKAAFEAEYGYPLAVPTTWEQHADIAEFFTRKAGDTLKGEVLDHDFYGVGLMAGRFPHIQDEIAGILWGWGGDFINDDGTPGVDDEIGIKATKFYVEELLPHAPPGALTSAYDEVVAQMRQGLIAMTASFYLDQWPNIVNTEKEIPGARMCAAAAPGGHGYIGAFSLGIAADSKHPDEAWEFVKFLSSPEAQRKFALGGGTTCRMSILTDPEVVAHRDVAGHYPALAEVFDYNKDFMSNFFLVNVGGKIYDEETVWYSAAAAGEYTPEEAMANLAEAIERICGGPCKIYR
ncbi:MAG TPA: ABC transporter substrate-binding protein [Chloroflexi bacterium]|nr:ABC transporter substrate-binding protein [Chloroflexota bacterium]